MRKVGRSLRNRPRRVLRESSCHGGRRRFLPGSDISLSQPPRPKFHSVPMGQSFLSHGKHAFEAATVAIKPWLQSDATSFLVRRAIVSFSVRTTEATQQRQRFDFSCRCATEYPYPDDLS